MRISPCLYGTAIDSARRRHDFSYIGQKVLKMRKSMVLGLAGLSLLGGCASMEQRMGWAAPPPPPDTVVFFKPQTAVLDQPALAIISNAAAKAQAAPSEPITVIGAADSIGAAADNEKLSIARAQAVANTLEADGVAASRITVSGVGETAAPAPGHQFARRVLIHMGS
jgi:hypothetical protein